MRALLGVAQSVRAYVFAWDMAQQPLQDAESSKGFPIHFPQMHSGSVDRF